jgi:hypothetical protein
MDDDEADDDWMVREASDDEVLTYCYLRPRATSVSHDWASSSSDSYSRGSTLLGVREASDDELLTT